MDDFKNLDSISYENSLGNMHVIRSVSSERPPAVSRHDLRTILEQDDSPLFSEAMQKILNEFKDLAPRNLQDFVRIILQKKYFSGREICFFVRNAIFLMQIMFKIA